MSLTDLPTTSPKTLSLAGKTAIISNSSNSAKIARELAQNGANVAFHNVSSTSSSKERAEKLALGITSEFGTKTTVVQGSVKNYSNAKTVIEQILKGFGVDHIDILGNFAHSSFPWIKPGTDQSSQQQNNDQPRSQYRPTGI
jgi:enoyl-[acyl-carrier-protein] reductase (NADH)